MRRSPGRVVPDRPDVREAQADRPTAQLISPWRLAAAGIVVALFVTHSALFFGRVSPVWDGIDFFAPYYMLVADFARNGRFLLWNPFTFGGLPDYLEPVVGSFSPLIVLFGLVFGATRLFYELYWLFVWLLGGLGMLVLARYLGVPPWGGFVAAIGFAFSGFYTGNAEHTSKIYALSVLPWLVWRVDVAVATRSGRAAAEAGALYGLSGLSGYPPLVFLNGCFTFLWCLGRVLWSDPMRRAGPRPLVIRLIGVHVVVVVLGATIMAPTYVPFFIEGPDVSDRAGPLPWDDAVEADALHPAALVTLSSPVLSRAEIFEYTDISMRSLYVGCLVLALAGLALLNRRAAPFRWWLFLVAVLYLASAMGRALPLRGWEYEWIPPMRYFRHAALFRGYTIFALAVLASFGASDLTAALRSQDRRRWRRFAIVVSGLAVAALLVYSGAIAYIRSATSPPHATSDWHTWGTWLLLAGLAWTASARHRRRELVVAAFVTLAVVDALSTSRLTQFTMYTPLTDRWHAVDGRHNSELDLTARGLMRVWGNDDNHTFLSKTSAMRGFSGLASRLIRRYTDDKALVAGTTGADRLWFSSSPGVVERSEHCFEVLSARAATPDGVPLVVHPRPDREGPASPVTGTGGGCDAVIPSLPGATRVTSYAVVAYDPVRLTLRVDAPGAGWLLVTDTWSRRWFATVNGRESVVFPGNFVFRAVSVPAGTSVIDFRYHPIGFPWLLAVSWGVLLCIGTWSVRQAATRQVD